MDRRDFLTKMAAFLGLGVAAPMLNRLPESRPMVEGTIPIDLDDQHGRQWKAELYDHTGGRFSHVKLHRANEMILSDRDKEQIGRQLRHQARSAVAFETVRMDRLIRKYST